MLDRDTGKPLFPISERAVPASDATGEVAAPTQPISSLPALSPTSLSAADLVAGIPDAEHRAKCVQALAGLRNDGIFTPPSERGSLVLPSNIGGAHWGGVAFDPATQTIVVPTNRIAAVITLIPRADSEAERARGKESGERLGLEYAKMTSSPYVLKREIFTEAGPAHRSRTAPCTRSALRLVRRSGTCHSAPARGRRSVPSRAW